MKYTDPAAVRNLSRNIGKDIMAIQELVVQLDEDLKKLQYTYLDDGIEEINQYVASITKKVRESEFAIITVSKQLNEYANLLEEGK